MIVFCFHLAKVQPTGFLRAIISLYHRNRELVFPTPVYVELEPGHNFKAYV